MPHVDDLPIVVPHESQVAIMLDHVDDQLPGPVMDQMEEEMKTVQPKILLVQ
jgi:hypothetical protein